MPRKVQRETKRPQRSKRDRITDTAEQWLDEGTRR